MPSAVSTQWLLVVSGALSHKRPVELRTVLGRVCRVTERGGTKAGVTIWELSERTGVNASTIRYYERRAVLPLSHRLRASNK
ncbi:MerR family DNA-binding transcriptional regulator, partial [Methylobacterium oxalidis]